MKLFAVSTSALICSLIYSLSAAAFSPSEHQKITQIAGEWLNECIDRGEASPKLHTITGTSIQKMVTANKYEDNLINIGSKWGENSHFYNPIKRLDWRKGDPVDFGRGDADDAVILSLSNAGAYASPEKLFERMGQVLHFIQDTSSPLHVVGVNHGNRDGFENNSDIDAFDALQEMKVPCRRSRGDVRSPLEILRANATATLKINDQSFNYRIGNESQDRQTRWSDAFFVNKNLSSEKLSALLKRFDPLGRMFKIGSGDFPAGSMDHLPRGGYGVFAGKGGGLRKDNFGQSEIEVIDSGMVKRVHIDRSEYVEYKKKLVIEAIEASMEFMRWGLLRNSQQEGS